MARPSLVDVEFYFIEECCATGILQSKEHELWKDPFKKDKTRGLEASLKPAVNLAKRLKAFDANKEADLKSMIYVSLWGNRSDLSIWAMRMEKAAGEYESENEDEDKKALLTDDSNALCAYLLSGELKDKSVSLIVDNAGFELVCDLALANSVGRRCAIKSCYE